MSRVMIKSGESVSIGFYDEAGECDGEFEVHFNTLEHPNRIVVKETADLPGSVLGAGSAILYEEHFDSDPAYGMGDQGKLVETFLVGELEATEKALTSTLASREIRNGIVRPLPPAQNNRAMKLRSYQDLLSDALLCFRRAQAIYSPDKPE